MTLRIGDRKVDFVRGDLAAAEVVTGREAGIIGVEGQFGEGFLLDLEEKTGVGSFRSGDFEPEADAGKEKDGLAVELT